MTCTVIDLDSLPVMLTISDVERVLGISRAMAYQLAHRKDFPAVHFGKAIRVPRESLKRWIEVQAQQKEAC